ncbi:MAG TPA: polysaccharide biosynthesis tyrosine autokinase [Longimicrobiales bacterium]
METAFPPQNGVPDDEIDLRDVWHLLLRNRWLIAGCTAVVVALAGVLTIVATPVYEASTSIRIDEEQTRLPVLDILQTLSGGSEVETEMEVLRSRTLAEMVVDSLGLQLAVVEPARVARKEILDYVRVSRYAPEATYVLRRQDDGRFEARDVENDVDLGTFGIGERIDLGGATVVLAPGAAAHEEIELATSLFEDAVESLRETVSITRPNREANIVIARYESPDTALVHQVLNKLAEVFIAQRQQIQKTQARSTVDFLREQIDTMTAQLTAAEEALRRFREGAQVVSLETEASAQVQQLAELQAQRNAYDAERAALAALLEEVRSAPAGAAGEPSPFRRLMGFPSLLRNQAASELLRSLAEVENQRANLLRTLTMQHPDVQILTGRIRELENQLRSIAVTYLQGLTNQVASLDATLARFGDQLAEIPAKEVQFARLKRQTVVLEEIYTLLQTRLKEAEIAQAVDDPTVRVVDPAVRPLEPIRPRTLLNLALGAVLGLMLGVGIAFLREFMDTTVHTREDVQEATGAPVLGLIPRIRAGAVSANGTGGPRAARARGHDAPQQLEARLVTGHDPRNPVSEAYRSLRTNITFSRLEQAPKTLVFTSPTPGEGKSTTSANLAITLAQQGLKVLLVDADLRRGVLNSVFHTQREPGLSNVLLGTRSFEEAKERVHLGESGTLDFLASGTFPPNPAELLGSARMRALLERLEAEYDAIILDAPPLNVVTDAALLGTNADGVIIVARAGRTEKAALSFAVEQLRNVRAGVLGAVLNDIDYKRDARYSGKYGSYGYYYQYYYGAPVS